MPSIMLEFASRVNSAMRSRDATNVLSAMGSFRRLEKIEDAGHDLCTRTPQQSSTGFRAGHGRRPPKPRNRCFIDKFSVKNQKTVLDVVFRKLFDRMLGELSLIYPDGLLRSIEDVKPEPSELSASSSS